jgi:hypothetical protein
MNATERLNILAQLDPKLGDLIALVRQWGQEDSEILADLKKAIETEIENLGHVQQSGGNND